jgi:uncharacterized protein
MGMSAKNVILVGDEMQLPQPLKGSHPGLGRRSSPDGRVARPQNFNW